MPSWTLRTIHSVMTMKRRQWRGVLFQLFLKVLLRQRKIALDTVVLPTYAASDLCCLRHVLFFEPKLALKFLKLGGNSENVSRFLFNLCSNTVLGQVQRHEYYYILNHLAKSGSFPTLCLRSAKYSILIRHIPRITSSSYSWFDIFYHSVLRCQ